MLDPSCAIINKKSILCSKAGVLLLHSVTHHITTIKVVADPSREEVLEFNYRMPKFNDDFYFSLVYFLIMP